MFLTLVRRPERSRLMSWLSPVLALALTVITGAIIFALRGDDPVAALTAYFIEPLSSSWSIEQLIVKASPLMLIGAGLAVCYRANVWNIGAEGQLVMGAVFAGAIPVLFPTWQSPLTLLSMIVLGAVGGMAWAAIPAFLRTRFHANEILTSLMLVYVAQLLLDWLVRGPWRDPQGFNFPKSISFDGWQLLPNIYGGVHAGVIVSVIAALALGFMMSRTLKGFEIRVTGASPPGALRAFPTSTPSGFAFFCRVHWRDLPVLSKFHPWSDNCSPQFPRAMALQQSSLRFWAGSIRQVQFSQHCSSRSPISAVKPCRSAWGSLTRSRACSKGFSCFSSSPATRSFFIALRGPLHG
jgi:ribose/xylose/arabinose/galactoside ABC-type transport system permease subunit